MDILSRSLILFKQLIVFHSCQQLVVGVARCFVRLEGSSMTEEGVSIGGGPEDGVQWTKDSNQVIVKNPK